MSENVLQISPSFLPSTAYGGPSISVYLLSSSIAKQGINLTVFTSTADGKIELPSFISIPKKFDSGIKVYYFPRITKDHSHFSPKLLWKVWRETKNFDVVHIHSWWNLIAIFSTFILLAKKKKPIISIRGMLSKYTLQSSSKRIFHQFIGRHILKKCVLHVTSEKEKQECQEVLGAFDFFILPNFITLPPHYSLTKKHNSTVFKFCTLSRIHPVKNLETTFLCLSELGFEWEMNIIGKGENEYQEQLKKLALTLNISDRIVWHGHLENETKYQILADTDLYIQLSLTENFGNSIIEAASIGLPVLISDTTGAAEYVKKLELGWVVPLKKDKIINAIKNAEKNIRKGEYKAKATKVRTEFSGKSLAEKYLKAYNSFSN